MMKVSIEIEKKEWRSELHNPENDIVALSGKICEVLSLDKEYELSLLMTGDDVIKELNCKYRNKDKPTNILSFPYINCESDEIQGISFLGDLAVSYETIKKESEKQSKEVRDHFLHMVTHGVLHLLGYNHENDEEAEIMERKEAEILAKIGICDPYEG